MKRRRLRASAAEKRSSEALSLRREIGVRLGMVTPEI